MCAISVEEIWRGVRANEESAVRRLFNGLRVAPLGVAEDIRAGAWWRELAERGVTLHVDDFPMPELTVEDWPANV